jgi:solute carrier family 25 (mitochondrial folate transporter), member 32
MISSGRDAPGAYRTMADGVSQIYRREGLKGFYRGLVPSLFGVSHGAIQFVAYEQLKNWEAARRGIGTGDLNNIEYLATSSASKIFAGSITYPYQVLRSRLQMYEAGSTYRGVGDVMKQVWKKEGIRGFYKGYVFIELCSSNLPVDSHSVIPNIVRVLPNTCVTFLVYENTKFYLPRVYAEAQSAEA